MVVTFYQLLDLNPYREEKVDEEALMEMIKSDPSKVKLKYRFDAFDEDNLYPLHMVCALGASVDCVKACYKAHPEAMEHVNTEIGGPVHYACAFGASVEVVHYLAKKLPQSLETPNDKNKQTPLHLACQQSTLDSDVVIFLTERCAKAAEMTDSDGRTPLHLACLHDEPNLNIIEDLTEVNAAAGVVKALDGSWPLWSATRHNVDIAIIKDLIVSNPQCCSLQKKDSTILHRAIELELFTSSILKDMIKAHPAVLEARDSEDRIPLHYAIECDAPFPIIELFVLRRPETVDMQNSKGEIPHKLAERLGRHEDTVEFLNPFEEEPTN